MSAPTLRPGRPDDADWLAELVNHAGEGLPLYLWEKFAKPGESAWDVGRQRASREQGSFSYRNATMIERQGEVAGCLIGYPIVDVAEPIPPDMPAMFRPLQELENQVPGTWYVNVLAVRPPLRGLGFGSRLLAFAEETGRRLGNRGLSVIVADANTGARRLYARHGYVEIATRPMVKDGWVNPATDWVLLAKAI